MLTKKAYLSIVFILCISCTNTSIIGNWKFQSMNFTDARTKNILSIDRLHIKESKDNILNYQIKQNQFDLDTSEVKDQVNKTVDLFLKKQVILKKNNQFEIIKGGFLFFTTMPGVHFGNEFGGTWHINNDTLTFQSGDSNFLYYWKFNILELSANRLKLKEISQGVENTNDITMADYEIEFYR